MVTDDACHSNTFIGTIEDIVGTGTNGTTNHNEEGSRRTLLAGGGVSERIFD